MTSRRPIYDAHHHLWDLEHCHYPWLAAKGVKRFFGDPTPIQNDYLAEDLLEDAAGFELVGSTHVQVGTEEAHSVKESEFVQSIANSCGNIGTNGSIGSAIIGFADLTRADLSDELDRHAASANFRGIRQIIGRHPSEDAQSGSGSLLESPAFERGLSQLANKGLSFDLQLIEANYQNAIDVFSRAETLQFVICHYGSPWDLSEEGFRRWQSAMAAFAQLPGAHIKFSGMGMFMHDWDAETIRPYVETALDLLGEERCMAGTNFPVDKLYGGYDRIWLALETLLGEGATYHKVTLENAQRFYRAFPADAPES